MIKRIYEQLPIESFGMGAQHGGASEVKLKPIK
jgi:hypothetical protein